MLPISPLILLALTFRVVQPINKLPFFHGPHWSALFRHLLRPHLSEKAGLSEAGIWIHPVETGILSYHKDDLINIGLTLPEQHASAIAKMLNDFNVSETASGHFQPVKTIVLEKIKCRLGKVDWTGGNTAHLTGEDLEAEICYLQEQEAFTLCTISPLRLTRPEGLKHDRHRYCDEEFFLQKKPNICFSPILALLNRIRAINSPALTASGLEVTGGGLLWVDVSYGENVVKTIGGVAGTIRITGRPSAEEAARLVIGQYSGVGKNAAFGLGFYSIPELDSVRKVLPLARATTLKSRAFSIAGLKTASAKLPNSSPGPDGLAVTDLRKAGDIYCTILKEELNNGSYAPGRFKKYQLPKEDGSHREICVQNVSDRLVQRAAADGLSLSVEELLSKSSYAYRRGLNRKGAAAALQQELKRDNVVGLKADITAFFDSVDTGILTDILTGLYPFEPIIGAVSLFLRHAGELGVRGLLQGSPLSPLLSNLYLTTFDKAMELEGFRLIRYGDDLALFFRDQQPADEATERVRKALERLGLGLKQEKTVEIRKGAQIKFLGYLVSESAIAEKEMEDKETDADWMPVFSEEWTGGVPVYLTSLCRGAYSSGPDLVIQSQGGDKEQVPWSRIGRVVVVGRASFSGGMVYRAVKEGTPVTFIDVMGRTRGRLIPEAAEVSEFETLQRRHFEDSKWVLSFAKAIIEAKVHNSHVILRRRGIDCNELEALLKGINQAPDIDTLRGFEGAAARKYFEELSRFFAPFDFNGRVYHPPDGPVNVMLSMGYTLLYNRVSASLKDKGFNPRLGFFHRGRGTHAALASDLIEELRHIAERITLSLINKGEVRPQDFVVNDNKDFRSCKMLGEGFRRLIHRFETTMSTMISYQGGKKMSYNAYLDEMSDNLKRALKMNIPYKPLRID